MRPIRYERKPHTAGRRVYRNGIACRLAFRGLLPVVAVDEPLKVEILVDLRVEPGVVGEPDREAGIGPLLQDRRVCDHASRAI